MYKGICTYIRTYVPVCTVRIFVHIENILVHAHTTHTHTYTSLLYMHCSAGGLDDVHTHCSAGGLDDVHTHCSAGGLDDVHTHTVVLVVWLMCTHYTHCH